MVRGSQMQPVLAVLFFATATAVAQGAEAPETGPLTLADCLQLAHTAPSSVATVARLGREAAAYGVRGAGAAFLPRVAWNSGVTFGSTNANREASFVALNGPREYQSFVEATWDIDLSGRLRAGLARARADRDAANATATLTIRDLGRAVTTSYFRVLVARHLVQSAQSALEESRAFEKRSRALFEGGEVAQADIARARLQTATLEQAIIVAEVDARIANQDLASFWTSDLQKELALDDVLMQPAPSPWDLLVEGQPDQQPYLGRPELRLLEAQREGILADFRHARAGLFPTAVVKYQYGFDTVGFHWQDRGQALLIGLSVPIFDFLQTPSLYQPLRLRAQMVEVDYQIAKRTLSRDYQGALTHLTGLYQQLAPADAQVKAAVDNLQLARVRYEGGEGLALEVVSAQTQLAQARSNDFNTRAAYHIARAELKVAKGK